MRGLGDIHDGATIMVDVEADELVVRWRNADAEAPAAEPVGATA